MLVLAAGAVLVALAGASVANSQHASLRCEDDQLVPYTGRLLPLGERPLDDPGLPPLAVEASECEDEQFESRAELRERHRELTAGWADAALLSEDPSALETSLQTLERLPQDEDEVGARRRQIIEALLRANVAQARESLERARLRLQQARDAGVDEETIRAAEEVLESMVAGPPDVEEVAAPPEPAPPPQDPVRTVPPVPSTPSTRSL